MGCLLVAALLAASPARSADSLGVRFEVGTASDVSNEQFYESSIDDTTFLGRRLYGSPQTRLALVMLAEVSGESADGRWRGRVVPDVSIGDRTTRLAATGSLEGRRGEWTRFWIEPRLMFERDESFGATRRDWRASLAGRIRRSSLDELGALRFAVGSEVVRATAGSDPFVLSGTSARASVGYERTPLFGWDWDLEYGAIGRIYRDSTSRDHVEHHAQAGLREDFTGGHTLSLEAGAERRVALRDTPGSRDRFAQGWVQLQPALALGTSWRLEPTLRAEYVRYDDPDSLVDFDYRQFGVALGVRREFGARWRATAGPRADWLRAPWSPAEEYDEVALALEIEWLGASGWWNLAPMAGRRDYRLSLAAAPLADPAGTTHSSFDFLELTAFLDQRLPAGIVVRALGTTRYERHARGDDDARSLYFSVDVRRLF